MKEKIVLGVIGSIGAGKDTVSDYLAKKGFEIVSFRDVVKDLCEKEGLVPNRENMQMIGKAYREKFGPAFFATEVMKKVSTSASARIVVKEMRTEGDVSLLKKNFPHMKIIQVLANKDNRFERMASRGRLGDPKTLEDFDRQERKEEELGFTKSFAFSDYKIENDSDFEDLYKKIDELLESINI